MSKNVDAMLDVLKSAQDELQAREVLRCTVNEFNGPEGVAKELYNEYSQAPSGGANRMRILLTLFDSMLKFDPGNAQDADPETLKAILKQQLEESNVG